MSKAISATSAPSRINLCYALMVWAVLLGCKASTTNSSANPSDEQNSPSTETNNDNHNLIADHTVSKEIVLRRIPKAAIDAAKEKLVILYNGTSHTSQVLNGMRGLMQYKPGDDTLFAMSMNADTPTASAIDLRYNYIAGDHLDNDTITASSGHPLYFNTTVEYLDQHEEVNVVVWGWHNSDGHNVQIYLDSFAELIDMYRAGGTRGRTTDNDVTFVFMSGRAAGDAGDDPNATNSPYNNTRKIRDYCIKNGYFMIDYWNQDVHDYETNAYDPTVDSDANRLHHDYVTSHTLGKDWFENRNFISGEIEYAAHTDENPEYAQHLTGNIRAYGAWWVWARIAGWNGVLEDEKK